MLVIVFLVVVDNRSREISLAVLTEDGSTTLALVANNSTHGGCVDSMQMFELTAVADAVSNLSSRGLGVGIKFTLLPPLGVLTRRRYLHSR
jgi:hypothetical protein